MTIKNILNNKVVKAGSWYTFTEFFVKGISFLTIPIFTRLLNPDDYGMVSLYLTWVGIFTIIISLNLNTSITKAKYDYSYCFDQYVRNTIILSMIIFVGFSSIFVFLTGVLVNLTGLSIGLLYFMLFQSYFTFIKTSIITKFRMEYNYKKISLITIVIAIIGVLLSIFFIIRIFPEERYFGRIIGNGILIIIFGIVFLYYLLKLGKGKPILFEHWKYAILLSAPLVLHSISGIVNGQFDRIVISKYIGNEATGLYSFAYNVGMIISVLIHSLDQAWTPWVYENMEQNNFDKIKRRGANYRDLVTLAYSGILLLSPEIIRLMSDESYWEALYIIPWIFMGYYFSYMYTLEVKTEFFYKKTGLISIGTFTAAVINIILNLIFVPQYGYIAAAITTTISYMFLFIFHYNITKHIIKKSIYGLKFHLTSILYIFVVTSWFFIFRYMLMIRIIGFIIITIYFYLKVRLTANK